ncbi:hypothetical protein [Neptunitalea chrysea]|nr:hypothetical protein [Neptunitalea chrysea]
MQLERTLGDFKQVIWFRTSIKNYRDEVVNFEIHLKVENEDYQKHCINKYNYPKPSFISEHVEYLKQWNQEYCEGWYRLQLDDNIKIAERITENITSCVNTYLDVNSSFDKSLEYRLNEFNNLDYFGLLIIPDLLILSELTNNKKVQKTILEAYENWKQTDEGIKDVNEGADIFDTIDNIKKLL